jgi:transcriptional regulator with XRE-family HTH domain
MEREVLLREPEWYKANIQNDLYNLMYEYMQTNKLKKKDLAEKLGVSKAYITQIFKGEFDHKISKMIEIALAFGKAPVFSYPDLEEYIKADKERIILQNTGNVDTSLSVSTGLLTAETPGFTVKLSPPSPKST